MLEQLLEEYKSKSPEVVFEWNDAPTGAKGWVVINSLRGGAAGGGTRMRKGLNREEVTALAKTMEVKFSVCGPDIGGAKSGIDFDPQDPRKDEVLQRWYKAVIPLLKHYYGTGGDLNVDELKDVIPITEDLGLWHPQEGIVMGHIRPSEGERVNILGQLRQGVSLEVENEKYAVPGHYQAVADLITGWGVAESVKHYHRIWNKQDLTGKRVIIQGWGNVASAAAYYLACSGAKIVGILDIAGGVYYPDGLTLDQVTELYTHKNGNKLNAPNMMSFQEANAMFWDIEADVFIPGAASKLLTKEQVERMIKAGVSCISCGANVPFIDDGVFFGPTAKFTDEQISLIPDFIANCGMARVFAFLMQPKITLTDASIFEDVSDTIGNALEQIFAGHPQKTGISSVGLLTALKKLSR